MGVQKTVIKEGNGVDRPKKYDNISIVYTGWIYDESKPENNFKGFLFSSTELSEQKKDEFIGDIGIGEFMQGFEEAIPEMSLGEKSTLTISSDLAYDYVAWPEVLPPYSRLIFDVELKSINGRRV
ncbi:MAG: hypothetical protein M1834_000940 [Cirrosporium novae-zelandiae]|nr:MAG: hypothetical protein M1834_000940 [Cirrosporium novae-zelandiae]